MTTAAKDEMTLAAKATETAAYSDAGPNDGACGRQTFVLGIFPEAGPADMAIQSLAASPAKECDVLLVSGLASTRLTPAKTTNRVTQCSVDALMKSGIAPRHAAKAPQPFSVLWENIRAESSADLRATAPGTQRLFQHVVKRLSSGATLLIVRTGNAEQRLATSRALLDANCEILLTHEVTPPLN